MIREVVYNTWSGGCGEMAQRGREKGGLGFGNHTSKSLAELY